MINNLDTLKSNHRCYPIYYTFSPFLYTKDVQKSRLLEACLVASFHSFIHFKKKQHLQITHIHTHRATCLSRLNNKIYVSEHFSYCKKKESNK